jgi:replicative DNA helicase
MSKDDFLNSSSCDIRVNNEALRKLAEKEEPKFLHILLKNKECLMDAISFGIKPGPKGHFWTTKGRALYNVIYSYYMKYKNPLTRTAIDSIMSSMSSIGGKTITEEAKTNMRMYWDAVWSTTTPAEDYEMLRSHMNERYVQWQAYDILSGEMDNLVKSTDGQTDIVKKIKERFYGIENMDADPYCRTVEMKDGLIEVMEKIENRRNNPDVSSSIYTGINAIDRIYHGLAKGSYTIISGMINGGKTTLMFNLAFNMAKAGYGVVYVSMEKDAELLFTRLLCLHALVDYNRIKIGGRGEKGLSDYYFDKLKEAEKDLRENIEPNLTCIQLAPEITKLSKIISEVDKVKAKKKIDVLFVDYLGVIGFETNHPNRPDLDEALVSKRLQSYGKVNNIATVTATQLKTSSSKDIRNKSKKATADNTETIEVNSEDMAGSKMIIADADNALGIVLNSDRPPTKAFVFGIKARDDQSRAVMVLDFDGKLGRICDPVLEPGQMTQSQIDDTYYSSKGKETIEEDDGLFDENIKAQSIIEATQRIEEQSRQEKSGENTTDNLAKKELSEIEELAKVIQKENATVKNDIEWDQLWDK